MTDCLHLEFEGHIDVNRLVPDDGRSRPLELSVDLRIVCLGCREPLRFICPDLGLLPDRPALSVDGLEIRIPARPSRDEPSPLEHAGFRITARPDA